MRLRAVRVHIPEASVCTHGEHTPPRVKEALYKGMTPSSSDLSQELHQRTWKEILYIHFHLNAHTFKITDKNSLGVTPPHPRPDCVFVLWYPAK